MSEIKKDYVLEIEDLTVEYVVDGEVTQAVTDVSLKVAAGTTVGLVGETGAGKTTTALAALRLVPDPPGIIKSGSIRVCGHDMMAAKEKELEKILMIASLAYASNLYRRAAEVLVDDLVKK